MRSPVLTKYGFRIRTRIGFVVDKLMIVAQDADEATQKLRQIYRDCQILECVCHRDGVKTPVLREEGPVIQLVA